MFNNIKEMINKMDKKKRTLMFISSILVLILIILGITYASYVWNTKEEQNTNVVFSASTGFSCAADGGGDINNGDVYLMPTEINDKNTDKYIKRVVKVKPTITDSEKGVSMDLWLNINELGSGLSSSVNFKYAFTKGSTSNTDNVVSTGNFNGLKSGDKVNLLEGKKYASTKEETYYLWIWIDASETNPSVLNQSFSLSLGGVCTDISKDDVPVVKVYADLGGWGGQFKAEEYVEKITKVEFVEGIDIPAGVTTFDLGTSPSETTDVKGWLIDDGLGNGTYTLKIGANGRIYLESLLYAFNGMINLKEISFDNLDTSETTNMQGMFSGCSSLTSLDLSSFNTSNVTAMSFMFSNCSGLTSLDLSNFDISKVTAMRFMFSGCSGLADLNIEGWNTSNIVYMRELFSNCSSLTSIDLSGFNTSNVVDMDYMFRGCSALTDIYVSNLWNVEGVTSPDMFAGCTSLPNFNSSVVDKTNAHYGEGGYLKYKAYPAS